MVIFDDELSAKQIRNIEAELKIKLSLIHIFSSTRLQTIQNTFTKFKYKLLKILCWIYID